MNFAKLDAFIKDMPKRGIPICEIAVAKDGEVVHRISCGHTDVERTKPVNNKTLYWIFSATKVITCIAAMRLVEEGRLRLDDPVSKYIPEFANVKVRREDGSLTPAKAVMTIEHLFTMTGGLSYDLTTPTLLEARTPTAGTLDVVRAMAKEPLLFEPGTHYKYSLCHDVLAAVVEIVTGMRFSNYLDMLLFKPLGITDMGFRPTAEQLSRFSAMYTFKSGTMRAIEQPLINKYTLTPDYDSGGAGLFASVDEYIKIVAAIANGGVTRDGYRILRPETIELMQHNRLCDDARDDFMSGMLYGYGWGLCGRAHMDPTVSLSPSPIGEFGWDGAANAFVMVDAINHIAVFYATQIRSCDYGYRVVHPNLRRLVYEGFDI